MKVEEALEIGGRLIAATEVGQEPTPIDAVRLLVGAAVNLARIAQATEDTARLVDSIDTTVDVRATLLQPGS